RRIQPIQQPRIRITQPQYQGDGLAGGGILFLIERVGSKLPWYGPIWPVNAGDGGAKVGQQRWAFVGFQGDGAVFDAVSAHGGLVLFRLMGRPSLTAS